MAFIERAKYALDWFGRGQIIVQIFVALGVGTVLRAIVGIYTHLNPLWMPPIWLASSGLSLWVLLAIAKWWSKRKSPVAQSTALAPSPGGMNFQQIEAFYAGHHSQFLQEIEDAIRQEAQKRGTQQEREAFLIRGMTVTLVQGFFEVTWLEIFGSQIRALERLNAGPCTIEELRPFFEQGQDKRPQYPFESWFSYLKTKLLIRQDGHNISITVRGREFLTWIVQQGRTAIDKPL